MCSCAFALVCAQLFISLLQLLLFIFAYSVGLLVSPSSCKLLCTVFRILVALVGTGWSVVLPAAVQTSGEAFPRTSHALLCWLGTFRTVRVQKGD